MLHCGTGIEHEVFHRRRNGSPQPDCGLAALITGQTLRRSILVACALVAAKGAGAAEPVIQLLGKGVQIYRCAGAAGSYDWRLKAPEATLFDTSGTAVGHHFAGPTWQASDGSNVVGSVLASSPSPQAGSVDWLILGVKSHSGAGRFADVAYVVRSQTEGGAAPASGCDAAHAGDEKRVSYQATYLFFPAAR